MSALVYGAVAELARVVEGPLILVGSPLLTAAQGAAGAAGAAVALLGSFCAEARPKGTESRFLAAVRSCREPHWAELQELLDEEADQIFYVLGLDSCEKVSIAEFQSIKPRLLDRCMELREDMKVVFERIDRRPYSADQEVDFGEVKTIFHLVLQARTDVIASMLRGDFAGVWRRIGDNTSGLVDAEGLNAHARSYAGRLPTSGIHFSEDDVVALADRFGSVYGNLPLEPTEFNAMMQELYFELLMMAWTASTSAWNCTVPEPTELPQPSSRLGTPCSANETKYTFHGACLTAVS